MLLQNTTGQLNLIFFPCGPVLSLLNSVADSIPTALCLWLYLCDYTFIAFPFSLSIFLYMSMSWHSMGFLLGKQNFE